MLIGSVVEVKARNTRSVQLPPLALHLAGLAIWLFSGLLLILAFAAIINENGFLSKLTLTVSLPVLIWAGIGLLIGISFTDYVVTLLRGYSISVDSQHATESMDILGLKVYKKKYPLKSIYNVRSENARSVLGRKLNKHLMVSPSQKIIVFALDGEEIAIGERLSEADIEKIISAISSSARR